MPEQSIGALWVKEGKNGKYLSGNVEIGGVKHAVIVFKNTLKKEGERTPDYRIFAARAQSTERDPVSEKDEMF